MRNKEHNYAWRKEWLEKNPDKKLAYQKKTQEWYKDNLDKGRGYTRRYRDKVRLEVFNHYGKGKIECVQCGFDNIDALCLDHMNDDGAEHRRQTSGNKIGGINFYKYIRANGYPDDLQLLCSNCNIIKEKLRLRNVSNNTL